MAILLRSVTVNELPLGTIITADTSEEARITRGMAEGALESRSTFGDVSQDGLPDDTLMVVFKAPEDVAVPLAEPDPDRELVSELLHQFDEGRSALTKRRRPPTKHRSA
jgi:hypothetical protein